MWNDMCEVYSSNAEKKNMDLEQAIELLKNNGYVVFKFGNRMKDDSKICEEANYEGECFGCSCNKCLAGIGD